MNQDYGMISKEMYQRAARSFAQLKGYDGWNIVKAVWEQKTVSAEERDCLMQMPEEEQGDTYAELVVQEKKKKRASAILEVQGKAARVCFGLTLYLMKPDENSISYSENVISAPKECDDETGDARNLLTFTSKEIQEYLAIVQDYNSIHRGRDAIVPGLLMLQKMFYSLPTQNDAKAYVSEKDGMSKEIFTFTRRIEEEKLYVEMTFRAPLHTDEMCIIVWK